MMDDLGFVLLLVFLVLLVGAVSGLVAFAITTALL